MELLRSCPRMTPGVYHYTWCPDLSQAMDMPLLSMGDDRARDGTHPGIKTVREWASRITQDLD
jgi:hypothetical protein